MREIIAIDPGPLESAYVRYVPIAAKRLEARGKLTNVEILAMLRGDAWPNGAEVVIETIASYGMPVGIEALVAGRRT